MSEKLTEPMLQCIKQKAVEISKTCAGIIKKVAVLQIAAALQEVKTRGEAVSDIKDGLSGDASWTDALPSDDNKKTKDKWTPFYEVAKGTIMKEARVAKMRPSLVALDKASFSQNHQNPPPLVRRSHCPYYLALGFFIFALGSFSVGLGVLKGVSGQHE